MRAADGGLRARVLVERGDFRLDVNFSARPGVTMLFGPSGAGKTTLLDCLAGLQSPQAGRIELTGRTLFSSEDRLNVAVRHRRVGYLFQDLALFPHLTAAQNVGYGLHGDPERKRRVREALERFRVAHLAARRPAEISGGERQRVALARALVREPACLLLDEPLVALDLPVKAQIMDDLGAWNREHHVPVLYVTHDRSEVFGLGERVLVMEAGRLIAEGTPQEVMQAPRTNAMAQLAGFENLLCATVEAVHPELGTTSCRLAGGAVMLECPLGHTGPGDAVTIGVRAGDILVSDREPQGLSARNLLPGTIAGLKEGPEFIELLVQCPPAPAGNSTVFHVHLTRGAVRSLGLAAGKSVWLVIKTHSCHLLRRR